MVAEREVGQYSQTGEQGQFTFTSVDERTEKKNVDI